ncbi:MAG TPA: hypothetical protein VFZ59_02345 [Verrucomicrobiae bacterium]|nr:hypothetical protein [Verrucomicrobiae bacterium]
MKSSIVSLFAIIPLVACAQDHGHISIGSAGVNQNDPLIFENRDSFDTTANYVKTLTFATAGAYAGYFQGNITITGLAATPERSGPEPNAAALGSRLFVQLVSVEGPEGGTFAFWESGATSPTISLASGNSGTNTWRVSENDGSPGSDPYGHIHGRRFTATRPGIYTVSFCAFDFSTNGLGGGPIHSPSSVMKVYFQAGVNLKSVEPGATGTRVVFSAPVGQDWVVEASSSPDAGAIWTEVGAPIAGDDYFHEVIDNEVVPGPRFYRARGTTPP